MSFDTGAELSLAVPQSELQSVRDDIEDGLTGVGLELDGSSMSAQSAGSGGRNIASRDRARARQILTKQVELLDDAVIYLEEIEDKVGTGGGGGGGGIITEVLGVAGETAGDVAVEAGDTVADAVSDVLTGTAATALGNTIASAVNSSTVDVEPNPLPVEGGSGGGNSVTVAPDFRPVFKPTFQPTVDVSPELDLPDFNFGGGNAGPVRIDESQLPLVVEEKTFAVENVGPLAVEDIGPIPVEDVGPITVAINGSGSGGSGGSGGPVPRSGSGLLKDAASRGAGGAIAGGAIGSISPDPFTTAGGAIVGGLTGIGSTLVGEVGRRVGGSGGQATGSSSQSAAITAEVSHSPTYNMEVDPRRFDQLADRIISELEGRIERDIDEVRDDLNEVERDLEQLDREIANRG